MTTERITDPALLSTMPGAAYALVRFMGDDGEPSAQSGARSLFVEFYDDDDKLIAHQSVLSSNTAGDV